MFHSTKWFGCAHLIFYFTGLFEHSVCPNAGQIVHKENACMFQIVGLTQWVTQVNNTTQDCVQLNASFIYLSYKIKTTGQAIKENDTIQLCRNKLNIKTLKHLMQRICMDPDLYNKQDIIS